MGEGGEIWKYTNVFMKVFSNEMNEERKKSRLYIAVMVLETGGLVLMLVG